MIRAVEAGDRAAWDVLWQAYLTFYKSELSDEVTNTTWSRLLDPYEPVWGALAFDEAGRAVGLVHWLTHRSTWSIADKCYLNDLFVDAGQRGKGTGGALIAHVEGDAAARGCAEVYWLTHETNHTAQRLYDTLAERAGFIEYSKKLQTFFRTDDTV